MVSERLNVDVADRTEGNSTVRLKSVDQAFAFHLLVELLFDGDKCLGRDALKLNLRLVADLSVNHRCVAVGAFDRMR